MLVYYKKTDKKYEQITQSQALELNSNWQNVFIKPDFWHFVFDKPSNWADIKRYFKYFQENRNKIIIIFDQVESIINTRFSKSITMKKFFDLIFWQRKVKEYFTTLTEYNDNKIKEFYSEINPEAIAPMEYFDYLQEISKKIYSTTPWVNFEETEIIEKINNNLPIEEIIKDLSISYYWFVVWPILVDMRQDIKNNLSWLPYAVLERVLISKDKIQNYLKQKWYSLNLKSNRTRTIEISKYRKIVFNEDFVEYHWIDEEWNPSKTIIFTKWINPIWYTKTSFDFNRWIITDKERDYFIIETLPSWKKIFISKEVDRKSFNKLFLNNWISFRWTEQQLLDLYDCFDMLNTKWELQNNVVLYKNWYYDDIKTFVHWWEIVVSDYNEKLISVANQYKVWRNKNNISVKKWYELLTSIYDEWIATLAYIRMIWAMMCIPFRKQKINTPLLIVTWESESGKSTLLSSLFEMFWFSTSESSRYISAQWLSPQPLLAAARDHVPLFVDEFTWDVNERVETVLRSFYDNVDTAKGRANTNEIYEINSPLIVSWEKIPWFQSAINRWLLLHLYKKYRKWTYDSIREIKDSSIIDDWIDKITKIDKENLVNIVRKRKTVQICWFDSRINDSCQRVMMVNEIFWICDPWLIRSYLDIMLASQQRYINETDEKIRLLLRLISINMKMWTLKVSDTQSKDLLISVYTTWLDPRELRNNIRQLIDIQDSYWYNSLEWWNVITISMKNLFDKWHKILYNNIISILRSMKDSTLEYTLEDFINFTNSQWLQNSTHLPF